MQATRERILNIMKRCHQTTVDELSHELGLTAVTVRHHLEILRGEGLVAAPLLRRRKAPGRPKYVYTLTEKASAFFPKRYDYLATLILGEVRSILQSPEEVDQMMRRIGERIAVQADLPEGSDFAARLIATIEFLNEQGYLARSEQRDNGDYLLHVANCPYERVSEKDQEVCLMDLSLLTRLLGTAPQRLSWSAGGDNQCTYLVQSPEE
jgi:predicted ArsR family transcriptional regulator